MSFLVYLQSSQVLELRRDVYQLQKEKTVLTEHRDHFKSKAQEWKLAALAHKKDLTLRKSDISVLQKEVRDLKKNACPHCSKLKEISSSKESDRGSVERTRTADVLSGSNKLDGMPARVPVTHMMNIEVSCILLF